MSRVIHAITTPVIPQWNRELLFKILDNIHDVVLVIDTDTTIVYVNEVYVRSLGVPVTKVLGRRLDGIEPNSSTINCLKTGMPSQGREYVESLNIDVVSNTFPLYHDERIVGAASIFKNITGAAGLSQELISDMEQVPMENPYNMKAITSRLERELIVSALGNYNNNRTQAMKALGISRRAFYDKLRKYGIEDRDKEMS
ncbi:helix-turn-helix domain-containing protein [Desulfitobacterium hafniense]|nr:helix-turn-helix domain-containing protein [Desulfitobacterium hafniense]KTE92797.1 Fis family transcriptional regulator [Desulfitobacterium hafniense]